ncbi:MAG: hypothetical protein ABIZ04_22045 [Opitutus sp.]
MDSTPPPPAPPTALASETPVTDDKTVAILSYITIVGFIVAVVLHGNKKTPLGTFHLRQALGLWITAIACWVVLMIIPVIGWIMIPFVMLGIFVLAVIGFIGAASGKMKAIPILGDKYQQWFNNTF